MSGIFVGRDRCSCFVLLFVFFFFFSFSYQQQAVHYPQLGCLSFIWQETPDSLGCQPDAKLRLIEGLYSRCSSFRYFEAVKGTEGWHVAVFHWCHSCANFIYCFSENIFHPGIVIAINENKGKQYKFYIPKLELLLSCETSLTFWNLMKWAKHREH